MMVRAFPALIAALALGACAGDGGGGSPTTSASLGSPYASPRDMVGKSGTQVTSAIGRPAFLRKDGEAQIWQYRGTNCLLDVFLYKNGGALKVKHAELRRRASGGLSESACLANAVTTGKAKG